MTLCDTRRELNDSYLIPRVIFKERPSPLIPTPTQSRWPIIEREAWAIIFAISLRLLTTLQLTTHCLSNATSYLILKLGYLFPSPRRKVPQGSEHHFCLVKYYLIPHPPLFPVCSGLKKKNHFPCCPSYAAYLDMSEENGKEIEEKY